MKTFQPMNWKKLQLAEVCDLQGGFAFKSKDFTQIGIPLIKISNIKNLDIVMDNCVYVDSVKEQFLVSEGDILIAMSGATTGKIGRYTLDKPAALNQRVGAFKPHQKLSSDYLFYVLQQDRIVSEWLKDAIGGAQPNINPANVLDVEVLLPSMEEQQKIAEVLSTVDKKIDLIDQKITETEKLKTGLMQKLFSEGVGVQDENGNWQPHTEFQDSPFGKVPSSWALETLEQRLDVIKDGTHFSPKSKEGPCKYLTSKNIRFGELDLTNISYISQEEHDRIYKGSPVKYGDILLTKDGANTGNAAINTLEEPFSLLSSVAYLRGSEEDVDHGYLLQLLLSPKGQSMMKSAMAGQAITRLTLKKIGAFVLPFAPIDEQNEIERILSTVDKKLQLLKKQKAETQQLKKGLMQKLLTGEWRVPVEEIEAA
ncbi:restriction endonuclease subunit S [Vibrio parahaemolyticus]|uniref:restriction endonuclease subunit S n=1 Tax=Vibrio parahaemolyticus TaxID=670 RepID=UPI00042625F0|nr:restriction endonuclease subunit S [Vibrio parahaemolyticus]EJK2426500.1 restriction endonuclease subunit S [Vibrio parahaemolyticus]ELA9813702.1 restriction endonuclease subunit S [Vibrio parahaemolyticus]TOA74320.1 restriction endonuclease subunit S [Vibrio parahaemolyticus]